MEKPKSCLARLILISKKNKIIKKKKPVAKKKKTVQSTIGGLYSKYDDYMTPDWVWKDLQPVIPKNKVIWEPFYGDGTSGKALEKLGFEVIHEDIDFFNEDKGDVIISNPPFSKKIEIFKRLKKLGKPFIIVCPSFSLNRRYVQHLFENETENPLQIMIPSKRINFIKTENGKPVENFKSDSNFECFYYCWKINLPNAIVWAKQ